MAMTKKQLISKEKAEEKAEKAPGPKRKSDPFMVTDAQQKAGESGYDNDGLFGIGMIKGVK